MIKSDTFPDDRLTRDRFYVIAHRGNSSVAPENTLASFAAAESVGADYIETDLQLTLDGTVVILHDESLERTSNLEGKVCDQDAKTISRADAGGWFSPAFTGVRLPTLSDLVEWAVPRPSIQWLLEFKGNWTPAQMEPPLSALRVAGLSNRAILQTFHQETLLALAAVAPDFKRALLIKEMTNTKELLRFLSEARTTACNPAAQLLQDQPNLLPLLQSAGQFVFPWTVDDPATWAAMKYLGVNGTITNRPGELLEWLTKVSSESGG